MASVLFGLASIWGGAKLYEVAAYRSMVSEAYLDSERSAHQLAVHTALTLAQTEQVMSFVKYEFEHDAEVDLAQLGREGLLGALDDITVSVADRNGRIKASTRMSDVGNATFADRAYFQRSRERAGVSLGQPVISRLSKRWVVPGALRLLDSHGEFDGAVLLSFDAKLLTRDYRLDSHPDSSVVVLGGDGIVRSRLVGSTHTSGQNLGSGMVGELAAKQGRRVDPAISRIDGVARYPSSVPIIGTDWVALVSTSAGPSLARHAELKSRLYGGALGATALLLLIVFALTRQASRIGIAETARDHDHELQRTILNAIPASIVLIDTDGHIAMTNESWQRDARTAAEELGEAPAGDFLRIYQKTFRPTEDALEAIVGLYDDARRGVAGLPPLEYLGLAKSCLQWFRLVMVPLKQTSGNSIVALHLNIHERKTAEEALRRSETLNRIAGRVARIGGWTMAAGSGEIVFSDELSALYELPEGQRVPLAMWLGWFPAEGRAAVEEGLQHCLVDGVPFDVEVESSTSTGRLFWARSIAHAIRDESGRIVELHGAVQDESEQHRALGETQAMKARLDVALASMTDAFFTLDQAWRFTYANPETERLLRVVPGQLVGNPIWPLLPDRTGDLLREHIFDAISRGTFVHVEDILTPSGAWCEARVYPSDAGVAIYLRDTTEQRRTLQQLRLMETCVSRMNDMIVITEAQPTDMPGPRIVFVNDALLKMSGYTRDELIGATPRILQGAKTDRAELDRVSDALRRQVPVCAELVNYTKSGEEYWIDFYVQPVFNEDGEAVHFLAVERDITQQRQDREELERSNRDLESKVKARTAQLAFSNASLLAREQEISSVLQNMADCVLSIDHSGRIRSANDSVHTLFGYSAAELMGEPLSSVLENAGLDTERATEPGTRGSIGTPTAATGLHRGGARIAVEVAFTRYSVDQQVRGTVIIRDIRERLKGLAELNQARIQAEDASKAKSAFVATMSHEIRTPMNGVIGMIDVLRETSLDRDQSQMLELARESAYSLMEVVEAVLDFSKIEAGKVEVETAVMSLPHVIGKVFDFAYTLGYKRGVRMSLFVDPGIPQAVFGDAVKIRQILLNLLSNGIKFCSAGPTTGAVEMRASVVHRLGDDLQVSIDVRDNGIGMNDETLGRLFQSFTQADASMTRRFGGTGLGLTIARDLTKLMGGDISVKSRAGAGSTFTVRLPFAVAPSDDASTSFPLAPGEHVVIVGGEAGIVSDLSVYLRQAGVEAVAVPTFESAAADTAHADRERPSLCIVIAKLGSDEIQAMRTDVAPSPLNAVPWVALLADGSREPRLASAGLVTLTQATLTYPRLCLAATMAMTGKTNPALEPGLPHSLAGGVGEGKSLMRNISPILVAEDNDVNQRVLSAQLDRLGYPYRIANNGAEALKWWKSDRFSIVITDLHMPEMDGFSLASAIRLAEAPGRRIPVIALTANALKDEANRCVAAGMDDYATKPLTFATLQTLLNTWVPDACAAPTDAPVIDPIAAVPIRLPLDIGVLTSMVGDDPTVIDEFLARFKAAATGTQLAMRAACERSESLEVGDHAHQLKSSARAFGAFALAEICESIESACNLPRASGVEPLLGHLTAEIAVLIDFLEHRMTAQTADASGCA